VDLKFYPTQYAALTENAEEILFGGAVGGEFLPQS